MLAPAGLPHLSALLSATAALALLTPLPLAAAENPTDAKRAIQSGLPHYDPSVYEKAQADKAARAVPKNAPAPLPEAKAASAGTA